MATVPEVTTSLAESQFTVEDLEAIEREHPELGRIEEIDGGLHATGGSAVGDLHQLVCQRVFLLFHALCPAGALLRLDVWWISRRGRIRADLGIYRLEDRPANRKSFRMPPVAIVGALSDDAYHDLVRKDAIYAEFGVQHRAYVEPWGRGDWWLRLDGVEHREPTVDWQLPGWPPIRFDRAALLSD